MCLCCWPNALQSSAWKVAVEPVSVKTSFTTHIHTSTHTHTPLIHTHTTHLTHTHTLHTHTTHLTHTHTHTHLTHTPPYTHTHTHLTHIHPSHTYTPPTHPSYTHHTQVSVIKAKLADELGMPTGKQKLQIGVSQYYITCT